MFLRPDKSFKQNFALLMKAIVNVGYKSDGVVAKEDIMLEEEQPLTEAFHEGDKIEVK